MGLLEVLTIIFVVLKLTEVIDWSWWLVFAPMYVYVVVIAVWIAFTFFIGIMSGFVKALENRKRKSK